MEQYSIPVDKILQISKSSLDSLDTVILQKHFSGKTNQEIVTEMSEHGMTPYLVWGVTVRWLNHFRHEPISTGYSEETAFY